MQEMKARGHSLNHLGPPKISFEIAEEIRALFRGGKFSQCELGTLYGVHQGTVSRIVLGKMHQLPSQATLPKVDPPPRPVVRKLSIEERFWAKVDKNGPVPSHCPDVGQCWIWTAAKVGSQGDQRGSFRRTSRRSELAHRVSWELTNGSIPEGLVVCHRCDLGLCVRPDHLFLGTQEENMLDMWHKCRAWNVQKGLHGKPPRI
jgi:transcriptional regulator with XRE-family HTH domain